MGPRRDSRLLDALDKLEEILKLLEVPRDIMFMLADEGVREMASNEFYEGLGFFLEKVLQELKEVNKAVA